jgi:hypothetical protein
MAYLKAITAFLNFSILEKASLLCYHRPTMLKEETVKNQ